MVLPKGFARVCNIFCALLPGLVEYKISHPRVKVVACHIERLAADLIHISDFFFTLESVWQRFPREYAFNLSPHVCYLSCAAAKISNAKEKIQEVVTATTLRSVSLNFETNLAIDAKIEIVSH